MGNVFAVFSDISPFVTIGWPVFAAWAYWQVKWYRRSRVPATTTPRRRRSTRSGARVAAAPQDSSRSVFTTLGLSQSDGNTSYGVPMSSSQSGPTIIS